MSKEQNHYSKHQKDTLSSNATQLFNSLYHSNFVLPILKIIEQTKTSTYWWLGNDKEILLHVNTGDLWYLNKELSNNHYSAKGGKIHTIHKYNKLGIHDWSLPIAVDLLSFIKQPNNPLQTGYQYRINCNSAWLALDGDKVIGIDLDEECYGNSRDRGSIILVNSNFRDRLFELTEILVKQEVTIINALDIRYKIDLGLINVLDIKEMYRNLDYNRCRLPKLEDRRFTDPNLGLWEVMGVTEDKIANADIRARDPALDVCSGNIAIDFGTSSTVVAFEDQHGRAKLLRIGADDYYAQIESEHYENPTVLEFLDFPAFIEAWQSLSQQPLVNWDWVRCSHEALYNFRNNGTNPAVVSSMLANIKQWALRESQDYRVRLTDQINGFEHELSHLSLRNPVKGQALTVSHTDPFDPVELYAWYLGLNINWRNRGIFLKYYMTFPVAYPKAVKEKILASFRRGLLRSLPASLFYRSDMIDKFEVVERGSEPIAYAISALSQYEIYPKEGELLAYAVFDFGGGTTDFDYGYYRYANDDEDAQGYEEVFEHYEAAGDNFLGGENLLQNMAYQVFKHNLDSCRSKQIMFTKPLDADAFAGSEMFIDKTQAAHTNTLILINTLRPYWERSQKQSSGVISVELISRDGIKQEVELSIPYDDLTTYLEERILLGIKSFFIAMKKAFSKNMPSEIHILLAGNSSRSDIMADYLYFEGDEPTELQQSRRMAIEALITEVFLDDLPALTFHAPLEANSEDESSPTAKTGVALGLLKLCPGTSIKFIAQQKLTEEAPFAHYVGRSKRGTLYVGIQRSALYDQWHELGATRERVFNLYHTQSNLAFDNKMSIGHNEMYKIRVDFAGDCDNQKVFGRAITPDSIEVCTAQNLEAIAVGDNMNIQIINLTGSA